MLFFNILAAAWCGFVSYKVGAELSRMSKYIKNSEKTLMALASGLCFCLSMLNVWIVISHAVS